MIHDVVDPVCKCPYGASVHAGGGVADATTACAILLVGDAHDGGSGCVEYLDRCSVWDDVVL